MRRLLCGIACAGCLVLSGCAPGHDESSSGTDPAWGESSSPGKAGVGNQVAQEPFWIGNAFCGYGRRDRNGIAGYEARFIMYEFMENDVVIWKTDACENSQLIVNRHRKKYKMTHGGMQLLIYDPKNLAAAERYVIDYEKRCFRRARKDIYQPEELWNMKD